MDGLIHDVRYSLRSARAAPGFVLLAALTLALGIGGTTAIYSFVSGILLTPLPYPDSDSLTVITRNNPEQGFSGMMMPARDAVTIRDESRAFSALSGYIFHSVNLSGGDAPERVRAARILPDLFPMLGIEPMLGRGFLPEEHLTLEPVAILGYELWQRRFGGDSNAIGETLRIDGKESTVVGILPPRKELAPRRVELLTPLGESEMENESQAYLWLVARLNRDVAAATAQEEVNAILDRWAEENDPQAKVWGAEVTPLRRQIVGEVQATLGLLLGAVALLLAIACANVAGLLLAHGAKREPEIAIRAAVGAPRSRIVRQLLTESVLLSLLGGAMGVVLAIIGTRLLIAVAPSRIPRLEEVGVDAPVLLATLFVTLLTGLFAGILPALGSSRLDLGRPLGGGSLPSGANRRFRSWLTVAQVALALTLSVGAGLMIRSFVALSSVDPGFDTGGVLTMNIAFPEHRYGTPQSWTAGLQTIIERVEALPDVESAAASNWTPMSGSWGKAQMSTETALGTAVEEQQWPVVLGVTGRYFQSLGLPLLRGRDFTGDDRRLESAAVIINQRFAARAWPGEDPIGKRLKFGGPSSTNPWFNVVGVVGDARLIGLATEEQEAMFRPLLRRERPMALVQLAVRTRLEPSRATASIRDAIWQIDNELPLSDVQTMEQLVSQNVARPRFNLVVLGVFAGVAVFLATIGVYGVVSQLVVRRHREIGLRMALGASRAAVVALVLKEGMVLVLLGVATGMALALAAAHLMQSLLYQLSATDPRTLAGVSLLLTAIATIAILLPALRATRIDPMSTLRAE